MGIELGLGIFSAYYWVSSIVKEDCSRELKSGGGGLLLKGLWLRTATVGN